MKAIISALLILGSASSFASSRVSFTVALPGESIGAVSEHAGQWLTIKARAKCKNEMILIENLKLSFVDGGHITNEHTASVLIFTQDVVVSADVTCISKN